jgi:hypothetical protein
VGITVNLWSWVETHLRIKIIDDWSEKSQSGILVVFCNTRLDVISGWSASNLP